MVFLSEFELVLKHHICLI